MLKSRAFLIMPILLSCSWAAHADDTARFSVLEENDYFAPDNLDRHYTQGLQLDYLTPDVQPGGFAAPMDWVNSALPFMFPDDGTASRKIDYFAGQELFTPQDKRINPPDPTDRPYAGWLEGGASYLQNTDDQMLDRFEVQIGLVGPGAKGEQTQNRFHLNIGETTSQGWGYQLRNEPTLNFYSDRHWRFDLLPADGAISMDAIPTAGLAAGNAMVYGDIGGMVRIGHNLHTDYGPNRIGPGPTGTAYFNNDKYQGFPIGWYVFAGVEGRAVGHNIFLQGNDFTESRSVEERPLVGDMEGGFALTVSNFARFSYTYLYRSDEFYGQHNGDHFGSILLSTYFPF